MFVRLSISSKREQGVAVNALWPKTAIATAATVIFFFSN
jgi:hypothetical protein